MSSITSTLPEDPQEAEKSLIRMVTDAYSRTLAWKYDQDEIDAIESDIRTVVAPAALGLSPEFEKWESRATAAGVIWEVDGNGLLRVDY
jgi:hypothetical protein